MSQARLTTLKHFRRLIAKASAGNTISLSGMTEDQIIEFLVPAQARASEAA